jgi:hypothetical protein
MKIFQNVYIENDGLECALNEYVECLLYNNKKEKIIFKKNDEAISALIIYFIMYYKLNLKESICYLRKCGVHINGLKYIKEIISVEQNYFLT